ncbi:MAG: hypothetical protein WD049_06950 [Candidatus Paceibacterota bacterium]
MLAALIFAHPWIFQGLARQLIRDDPLQQADFVVITGGDRRYDWVADQYAARNVRKVLQFRSSPKRLYEFGVLPYPHEQARAELIECGVDAEDIVFIDETARNSWERADQLERWMAERPDATVAVVADRLGSGAVDEVFRQAMSPEVYERISIHSLRDRRYDESDWWKSRRGMKSFYGAAVSWLTVRLGGRPEYQYEDDWDPEEYERELMVDG